jgi:nitroreductase
MEYFDLIKNRYSVRAYKPDSIEDAKLQAILDAARLAPTADNRQPFQLIVIHTSGREEELQRIYRRDWFTQAPIILCACGVPRLSWVRRDQRRYLDVDVAIVMDHVILAATNLGLGTCWIAAFNSVAAREILSIPEDIEPLIFTPIGYPDDQAGAKERKPLSELIRYEKW